MERRFKVRRVKSKAAWKCRLDEKRHREKVIGALLSGNTENLCREKLILPGEEQYISISFVSLEEPGFVFETDSQAFSAVNQGKPLEEKGGGLRPGLVEKPVAEMEMLEETWGPLREFDEEACRGWVLPGFPASGPGEKPENSPYLREERSFGLDTRRTLLANMKRNALAGAPVIKGIAPCDIRPRIGLPYGDDLPVPVLFLIRDVSDSMALEQRELCRAAFSRILGFVKRKYPQAITAFFVHNVNAREVNEEDFMFLARCGGTKCSSAYRLALETLRMRYQGPCYRCYLIHISDGNNPHTDNLRCRHIIEEILPLTTKCAYFQTGREANGVPDSLGAALRPLESGSFLVAQISTVEELPLALSRFFSHESPGRRVRKCTIQ